MYDREKQRARARKRVRNWRAFLKKSYRKVHWFFFEIRVDEEQIEKSRQRYLELRVRSCLPPKDGIL